MQQTKAEGSRAQVCESCLVQCQQLLSQEMIAGSELRRHQILSKLCRGLQIPLTSFPAGQSRVVRPGQDPTAEFAGSHIDKLYVREGDFQGDDAEQTWSVEDRRVEDLHGGIGLMSSPSSEYAPPAG